MNTYKIIIISFILSYPDLYVSVAWRSSMLLHYPFLDCAQTKNHLYNCMKWNKRTSSHFKKCIKTDLRVFSDGCKTPLHTVLIYRCETWNFTTQLRILLERKILNFHFPNLLIRKSSIYKLINFQRAKNFSDWWSWCPFGPKG